MAVLLPDGRWVNEEGRLSVLRKDVRAYLSQIAPIGADPAPLRSTFSGYPGSFDGLFPAHVIQASQSRGRHLKARGMPEWLIFFSEVYDSLGRSDAPPDEMADAIVRAEDACWDGHTEWLLAFEDDLAFKDRFLDVDVVGVETGASNRMGREFIDIRSGERLWRLRAEVRLKL